MRWRLYYIVTWFYRRHMLTCCYLCYSDKNAIRRTNMMWYELVWYALKDKNHWIIQWKFLRLSEANRKKNISQKNICSVAHEAKSSWQLYMEYSQALLLVIPDAPQFCQHFGSPTCWDFEFVLHLATPNLRTECHRFWKLLILDSETHTVRAPCWNWHQLFRSCLHVVHAILACLKSAAKMHQ